MSKLFRLLVVLSLVTLGFGVGAIVGLEAGFHAGSDDRAATWVVGCLQGVTIQLTEGVTIHCGQVKNT